MKKSFTLIEILVATTIFVAVMVIFLAVVMQVMRPKAKNQTMGTLQDTAKVALETIASSVMRVDTNYGTNLVAPYNNYYGFALTYGDGPQIGQPLPCATYQAGGCSGGRFNTYTTTTPPALSATNVARSFGVYKRDANGDTYQQSDCAPDQTKNIRCVLQLWESVNGGSAVAHDISGPDVDVTRIAFSGYYWTTTNDHKVAPYMKVTITVQSHYRDNTDSSGSATFSTLLSPIYGVPYAY